MRRSCHFSRFLLFNDFPFQSPGYFLAAKHGATGHKAIAWLFQGSLYGSETVVVKWEVEKHKCGARLNFGNVAPSGLKDSGHGYVHVCM